MNIKARAPLNNTMDACFTVAEIGAALGWPRARVGMAMAGIEPDGKTVTHLSKGHLSSAWKVERLPSRIVAALEERARSKGYRNAFHLLTEPPQRWMPPVPFTQAAPYFIEKAGRLQRALHTALALQSNASISDSDLFRMGYAAFVMEMPGHTESQFRRALERTIERDAGAGLFDEPVLYLDADATRAAVRPLVRNEGHRKVQDYLNLVKVPHSPTTEERASVWVAACEVILHGIEQEEDRNEKKERVAMARFLSASHVRMAANPEEVARILKRKFQKFMEGGMTLKAIYDRRAEVARETKTKPLLQEDQLLITGHAVTHCGGRLSQAWRELGESGRLSDQAMTRFVCNPASKSHVPKAVRRIVAPDVKRLEAIHHGPREHKLKGAFHNRDWSQVAAGDWMQSDDCTPPVYYYAEGARGLELMRGQFLPMIDERTTFILGFVLIPARNYNSLAIRSLISRVCTEHGLPRKGFSFERGIWKSSRILTGSRSAVPFEVADSGLRSLGLQFRHANLPRAKVIEKTLGLLQNRMEGIAGYCGRQEQTEKFERMARAKLDVEAGRLPVDRYFLSEVEMCDKFFEIVEAFNDTTQQGRKLNGLSPREGWHSLQSTPLARFDSRCQHLLAHDRRKLTVGRNGLTIRIGSQVFKYKGEETGSRQGEQVLAWFNPDVPETLACTDLAGLNVFTVPRSFDLPAVDATREQLEAENALIAAHNGYATKLYRVIANQLPQTAFRVNIVDSKTAKVGEEIEAQRDELAEKHKAVTQRRNRVAKGAARLGLPIAMLNPDAERTERGLELLGALSGDESEPSSGSRLPAFDQGESTPSPFSESEQEIASGPATDTEKHGRAYALKQSTARKLTPDQQTAAYWRAWEGVEAARPGLNRHAIMTNALGFVKPAKELSPDHFRKVMHAFSSIVQNARKSEPSQIL